MKNIFDFTKSKLIDELIELGMKKYTGQQVFEWLYRYINTFDDMQNISKDNRTILSENFDIFYPEIIKKSQSKQDSTIKYLLKLSDGKMVECVLMEYNYGYSICISSQAGCKMGCKFCASTGIEFDRNLTPGEMIGQIIAVCRNENIKIYSIVVMGVGEPLDNLENLLDFISIVNDKDSLNIGIRHITISTCGLVDKIRIFTEKKLKVNLSISLHSVFDDIRTSLMPINKKYPVDELLKACNEYTKVTGRRITFEYALIEGINDKPEDVEELYKKLKNINCHINLIHMNKVDNVKYNKVNRENMLAFRDQMMKRDLNVTIRRELGTDIDAACGQLRKRNML